MSADRTFIPADPPKLSELDLTRIATINTILARAAIARRAEINEELRRVRGITVLNGPFAGSTLPAGQSWGEGEFAPKLLGCYEEELHAELERAIARKPRLVVNVGCAEGYYAIGLARRLPEARVLAFDIDEKAQRLCKQAAADNGVAGRLIVEGICTPERLRAAVAGGEPALLFIDCEGAELDLLDEPTIAKLGRCDLIVECHDFEKRGLTQALVSRFTATHGVGLIHEGARDPNRFIELRPLSSIDRWMAICEFRPEQMHWLVCRAR